ncbi:PTS glucitol/sorbitol transporter subunit IIA [Segnochrobactrum spirostomi]|uniref:PTS cellobiose transporter subunit IIB n=1 Tax=Segnochrobactrum spirostomi TaxID=2608987 RepID=A0A6A7Y891_9HYPH|nr:PTS glucitol/sorbitol transporter subunit IIA [Segnochrobactrum spirostomi]MQT14208.1 PTS cellobiose transporter subunit IIB [Segnochrobactrum spirostomi]
MTIRLRTAITEVGPGVAELLEGGVLILFAEGAPPELAEMSILHAVVEGPTADAPPVGAELKIGPVSTIVTALGDAAWKKVADIGHVVINFDGEETAGRPGEICAAPVNAGELAAALKSGAEIVISD